MTLVEKISRKISVKRERKCKQIPLSYFDGHESTRTWGDEFCNDLLYTILLRRQRTKNIGDGLQWETKKIRLLKAGSIERLVDHLACAPMFNDENFLSIFLATYRTFILPYQVLDLLFMRHDHLDLAKMQKSFEHRIVDNEMAVKASILRAVEEWINRHPEDWTQIKNKKCRQLIKRSLAFCKRNRPVAHQLELKTKKILNEAKEIRKNEKIRNSPTYEINLNGFIQDEIDRTSINGKSAELFLNRLTTNEIAISLLAIDRLLFEQVIPWQCLGSVWSRRGNGSEISTVKATVRQFNKVVYLVLSTVLSPCLSLTQRSKSIEKWIFVAHECLKIKDYSSLRAIISGLQTHGIHRLKRTWSCIDASTMHLFVQIQSVSKEANNEPTSIPYLGHFLTDLMMIDAAYSDRIEGGRLINFEKRRKEFELLRMISALQRNCNQNGVLRGSTVSAMFTTWVSFVQPLTEQQGFELSQMAESDPHAEIEPFNSKLAGNVMEHSFSTLLNDQEKTESTTSSEEDSMELMKEEECASAEEANIKKPPLIQRYSRSTGDSPTEFIMARVAVEDGASALTSGINYRTIKIREYDRVNHIIITTLEKYSVPSTNIEKWKLLQRTENGTELNFPNNSSIYHAVSGYNGIILLIVKRKTSKEIEEEELQYANKKNKLYMSQTLSSKYKLCYASKLF